MKIISHRGYWIEKKEKNTINAFVRAFGINTGIETDIREYKGKLVVSHDVADGSEMEFKELLKITKKMTREIPLELALNIKSDGLALLLKEAMSDYKSIQYFVFDMSVPDMREYIKLSIPVFTRMSDVENQPIWIDHCSGIWLDSFECEWYSNETIQELLRYKKKICIVSPELHGREYLSMWDKVKSIKNNEDLILCTDYPKLALEYFRD